ncbi:MULTISPECIES: hypothetical protein [Prochlorococcus]|uniref:Uncharacterized protein n=2 Tax=Prochlorococcaceae TaxID=2881426 RepID=Q7VAE0_PROMA|nr:MULTISPECIES: hypothetical protein [Prochlorococcus]AAQ00568.1 Predicted protein family PM-12 [Prochlorococcus marinus subsp. marinus str. CCMP1375]KGG10946.1 putative protein family PM-12 [Prochlorococcus marinus str. LG]KGG34613.1 putative protein family PM-12 [Prochlorococcus sp. SS52]
MKKATPQMAKRRSQLNINIDPELLLWLKTESTKSGKTLTAFVTEKLMGTSPPSTDHLDLLENRLLKIEELLQLKNIYSHQENQMGTIFTDEGAKKYGEVAKRLFESHRKHKNLSLDAALKGLADHLKNYPNSNPELVFQILLGNHVLTGPEMTNAYRRGSCAMRSALCDWSNDSLEELNEVFLNAVITKKLA